MKNNYSKESKKIPQVSIRHCRPDHSMLCQSEISKDVTELHDAGDSPWPKISPEFDTAMINALETGIFEHPESGKTVDMKKARELGIAAASISCVALSQLKDIQGRPVVLGKKYLFREANKERNRMTDCEDDNLRRVVNNAKWHNGIHLTLKKQYSHIDYFAMIKYPGKGKYLLGTHYSGNDVTLNNNWSLSNWMFQDAGRDSHGFQCYSLWSEIWGVTDYGNGFMIPEFSVRRAGYDNDWEWRTGSRATQGWFNIMLERVNYNE